jgi:hypothetical protein
LLLTRGERGILYSGLFSSNCFFWTLRALLKSRPFLNSFGARRRRRRRRCAHLLTYSHHPLKIFEIMSCILRIFSNASQTSRISPASQTHFCRQQACRYLAHHHSPLRPQPYRLLQAHYRHCCFVLCTIQSKQKPRYDLLFSILLCVIHGGRPRRHRRASAQPDLQIWPGRTILSFTLNMHLLPHLSIRFWTW